MSMTEDIDHSTLNWVKGELDETLKQAGQALEVFTKDPDDLTQMRFCATYLHQVYAILQMLELFGAGMLAEEMENTSRMLLDGKIAKKDEAYEILMASILQLSDYLEKIQGGHRDIPILILPLMNDLRAIRGENLLSENAFFSPQIDMDDSRAFYMCPHEGDLDEIAKKVRHTFQVGLLGVIRGKDLEKSLKSLLLVLKKLAYGASNDKLGLLWWVAAGFVQTILAGGLKQSTTIKMLLGHIDRQLKAVIENGENILLQEPPIDLIKNLLFYIGRAEANLPLIQEIQERFDLKTLLMAENEVSEARDGISAPTNEMLETVSAAIKEDLDAVKEGLDLFLRNRQNDLSKIEGLDEILGRTGDTMGMIGLGKQRNVAKEKAEILGKVASGEIELSEQELMDLAGDLLYLEYALNNLVSNASGLGHIEDSEAMMPDYEYELVYISTLEEVINDIALVKEAVVNFVGTKDHSKLDGTPELFSRITGALQVVELGKCSSLLDLAGQYISQELHFKKIIPSEEAIDNLADTISSIEYYLEGFVDKSGVRDDVLALAISSLNDLGYPYLDEAGIEEVAHELEETDDFIDIREEIAEEPSVDEEPSAWQELSAQQQEPSAEQEPSIDEAFIDDLELEEQPEKPTAADDFIDIREEAVEKPSAGEEPSAGEKPLADQEPSTEETAKEPEFIDFGEELEVIGDESLGEDEVPAEKQDYSTLHESPAIQEDEFIEFEQGALEETLAEQEFEFIDFGSETKLEQTVETADKTGAAGAKLLEDLPVLSDESDPEILEIFLEEAEELYEDLQQYMPKWLEDSKNIENLGDIRRTYHTYKGSGRLAGATLIGEFAWYIEKLLNQVLDGNVEVSDKVSGVLQETLELLPAMIASLNGEEADISAVYNLAWKADVLADPVRHAELDQVAVTEEPIAEIPTEEFIEPVEEEPVEEEPVEEEPVEEEPVEEEPVEEEPVEEEPVEEESAEEQTVEEQEFTVDSGQADAKAEIAVPRMDPTLYDIFSNEVAEHLQVVKDCISDKDSEILVSEDMVRAMHTLAGSARMAAAEEVAEVGGALDKFIHRLQEQQTALNLDDINILENGVVYVECLINAIGDDRIEMPNDNGYMQNITKLLQGFDAEAAMDQPRPEAISADVDPDLVELFVEEADDILAFLETTVHTWESAPYDGSVVAELHRSLHTLKGGARLARFDGIGTLSHILETVSIDIAEKRIEATHQTFEIIHQAFDRLVNMVGMAKEGLNAPLPEDIVVKLENLAAGGEAKALEEISVSVQLEQQDMELVEVFLEEGDEILSAGQGVLQRWIEVPDNIDLIVEMQRALHTLKGGARMAGFWSIGNLGHALETLLIEVLEGRLSTGSEFFDVLENAYDRLGDMLNNAKSGKGVEEADDILKMLEALKKGEKVEIPLQQQKSAVEDAITKALEEPIQQTAEPTEDIQPQKSVAQSEVVRVKADLLDDLVNYAGEISIYRARTEQQVSGFRSHLEEMDQTVVRLREQLRKLEIETEAQILFRHEREHEAHGSDDFDPLELDRFSQIQQVSRAISETLNDINSITDFMDLLARDAETLLLQQSRVNTELQEGLVHSRMVPFSNLVPRMRRVVRQTCQELNKEAQIKIIGAQGEMDRTVLERITAPLEHMLRNAIAHGVEAPDVRTKAKKDRSGTLSVTLTREGPDIVIKVVDDGGGINHDAIRAKAQALGWIKPDDYLSDLEVAQFILETGFSTAESVTQIAGRGVGMDVVNNEIKQLGGTLHIQSEHGKGTEFTIRLPFTLAINHALLVNAAEETYAIPLSSIDGVVRLTHEQLKEFYNNASASSYEYAGQFYQVINMAALLGIGTPLLPGVGKRAPVVLVQTGDHRFALQVDGLLGSREIVVKAVGPQISSVPGVMGATILGNGSVVLILDIGALSRISLSGGVESLEKVKESEDEITSFTAMVVDDSITVRRVGARLLERNGFEVITAKDGVDAITVLQERIPDIMLLDIEMPRMDGFELATHMKNDERLKNIPIIMITSRTGEKHRERAARIGVEHYLGKPYQENELLQKILELLRITPQEAK